MQDAFRRTVGSAICVAAMALTLQAATALAISPQTLTDPVADNCRPYTTPLGTWCGPDITQAVFTTPGDGNLHVDISYASLPTNTFSGGFQITEKEEYVELGIYPKSATTPLLALGTRRVAGASQKTLQEYTSNGLKVVTQVSTATRALGYEMMIPLTALGDPANYRYAVNAGNIGETIPEHPDLAPETGLFDLAADATPPPSPPPTPPPSPPSPTQLPATQATPAIRSLTGVPANQRGGVLTGSVNVTVAGDLTIEALVPAARLAAKAKLKSIGKVTKRGVKAGKVTFRVPIRAGARKKLAGRKTQVTLRLTLKPASGAAVTTTRKVSLTVPR